jgi:hypothetical protein
MFVPMLYVVGKVAEQHRIADKDPVQTSINKYEEMDKGPNIFTKIQKLIEIIKDAIDEFFVKKSGFLRKKSYKKKIRNQIVYLAKKAPKEIAQRSCLRLIGVAIKHPILSEYKNDFMDATMKLFEEDMKKLKKVHKEVVLNHDLYYGKHGLDHSVTNQFYNKMMDATIERTKIKNKIIWANYRNWTQDLDRDTKREISHMIYERMKREIKKQTWPGKKTTIKLRARKAKKR